MGLVDNVKLALRARKAMKALEEAKAQGFKPGIAVKKGAKILAGTVLLPALYAAVGTVLEQLSGEVLVSNLLSEAGLPLAVVVLVSGLIAGAFKAASNAWSHRNGPKLPEGYRPLPPDVGR